MKVSANPIIANPKLRYKLDPGEPGMATPTPASNSVAKVATHEATNIRRFRREAAEDGAIVVYSQIALNMQYAGSFLAATSGKSKALVIYPSSQGEMIKPWDKAYTPPGEDREEETDKIHGSDADEDSTMNSLATEAKNFENPESAAAINPESKSATIPEIDGQLEKLLDKKDQLLSELKEEDVRENSGFTMGIEKKEDINKAQELDEIKARINYLQQLKDAKRQENLLTDIVKENSAFSMVKALYSGKPELSGAVIDQFA